MNEVKFFVLAVIDREDESFYWDVRTSDPAKAEMEVRVVLAQKPSRKLKGRWIENEAGRVLLWFNPKSHRWERW